MPLVYDPDTGEWIIDRSSSVSEEYGLSGDRKLTTAMSPDELDKRLGILDKPEIESFGDESVAYGLKAPMSWDEFEADGSGDVPDLPRSERFEFEDEGFRDAPEFDLPPREPDFRGIPPEEGITREPAEQDWFMDNLLKHMKLGGDPEKFKFGESYPTSDEIIQAEQTLSAETYETKEEGIKALRLQETGKWGPKEEAAQHGWRRAFPEYGTLEAEDVGMAQDPSTKLWRKELSPEAQAEARVSDEIKFETPELAKEMDPDASGFEDSLFMRLGTAGDEEVQQILDRGAAGEELSDEDLDKLAAETESGLVDKVKLPEDPNEPPPPEEAPTGEQNLVLTGLRVNTGKDRTYPIVGSVNEVAAFAAFDLQALSKADPMLKGRSKIGGVRITDFNRTIEAQMEQHTEQSREVAAKQPHVLGFAIDVDVRGSSTSPEFQFMKANAYKACYYWPAVKREDGSVEYHHWQHDCAAAKAQAKEWGFDESLTGTLATSYDRYQKGELTQEYMTRTREPGAIDWNLMRSPEDEGKIWPSDRPKNHVWSEAHGKYIHLNPNMSSKDLKSLSDQYRLEMGRLYPDNELRAQEAHTKFLNQIGSEIGKLSGEWYTTNERLNEQKQQITKAGEVAALRIADHRKKSAMAKSLAADSVVETQKRLNEKSQALMEKMQEDITKHEEFLANAEPDQFRLFGMFNKDGSFNASKLAFTLVAVPALILNLAASLGSKGKNRVPFLLWDMVSKAMDNDIQAQRDAITNNINAFNAKKTSFGYWNDFFEDKSLAAQKTYTDMIQASTAKLKALEAAQKDPFARLAISQAVQLGQQKNRASKIKFLGMLEQWARRKQDHSQKIIGQQQAVEVNAWKTRFEIFSKIMEENASGKTVHDLPGPLQRIYFGAKHLLPKIQEARKLWMRSGRDEKSGMIIKLIAGMDPDTFKSKVFRLPPMPQIISTILGTDVQVYEDLMRLNHLRHTMRATTSKVSGNVGNDNQGEQVAGMWNWAMEEGFRQGMLYLDKFEANARMMSSLAFYFQPGLEETKEEVKDRTGSTESYKGSSAYNTLLGKLGELQAKGDQQGQVDLIQAFTVEQHSLTMTGQNPGLPESMIGVGTPRKKRPSIQGRKGGY